MQHKEDWETVFEIYAGRPKAALDLAAHLMDIRKLLQRGSKSNAEAITALEAALDALYEHTAFNRVGQKFYYLCIGTGLNAKQEALMRELGVKF